MSRPIWISVSTMMSDVLGSFAKFGAGCGAVPAATSDGAAFASFMPPPSAAPVAASCSSCRRPKAMD
ncbi:MAG TPA: hypothetical protein VME45_04665 [Stellaceae bacterium]|nr:hypothetical protein [Stellaceae bacterium]